MREESHPPATTNSRKYIKSSFAIPYTQFNWGDYSKDTDYLSFQEHGAYWSLLRRYYTTGPFPDDIDDLCKKTRCPIELRDTLKVVLEDFFYLSEEDGCWHNKRCDYEIRKVKGISEVQSERARKGVLKRQRNSRTGMFLSSENVVELIDSPATAGNEPAIKELIYKNEEKTINRQDQTSNIQHEIMYETEGIESFTHFKSKGWSFNRPTSFPDNLKVVYFADCDVRYNATQDWNVYKNDGSFSLVIYSKTPERESCEYVYKSPKQAAWHEESGVSQIPSQELLDDLDAIVASQPGKEWGTRCFFSIEFDEYRRHCSDFRKAKYNDHSN